MAQVWSKLLTGPTGKNVHFQVTGFLDSRDEIMDWRPVAKMSELGHSGQLRLDSVTYALSDGLEVWLAWDKAVKGEEPHVFLPLSGRGKLDFDYLNGVVNTVGEGRTGDVLLYALSRSKLPSRRHFLLMLDFSKQSRL